MAYFGTDIATKTGYNQVINKPTPFINGASSFIDLVFSSNMSFIRNHGIEQSIFEKCHRSILCGALDFIVPQNPPYCREIWDYKDADIESIQNAVSNIDWSEACRIKNANENCKVLTNTLMDIFRNCIPHKAKNSTARSLSG